jgi:hypothetical protein
MFHACFMPFALRFIGAMPTSSNAFSVGYRRPLMLGKRLA